MDSFTDVWQYLILIAVSGVILGYFKYHRLLWRHNHLRSQHTIHNDVLVEYEKNLAQLNGKMNAVAVDIGGLFILYSRILNRVEAVEKELGLEPATDEVEDTT